MINELYQLSTAMKKAGVQKEQEHPYYVKLMQKPPCVRIVLSNGKIARVEDLTGDSRVGKLRKYNESTNLGSFPGMNLAPLYRITDDKVWKSITRMKEKCGTGMDVEQVREWCTCNGWGQKILNLYTKNMVDVPNKLESILRGVASYEPMLCLIREARLFLEPYLMRQELEHILFEMLEKKTDIAFALQVLFYKGKADTVDKETAGLSVILDSEELEDNGTSSSGVGFSTFAKDMKRALFTADEENNNGISAVGLDAFGELFSPAGKMPKVSLAAGFDVILRTMNPQIPCLNRYGRIGDASYPISREIRQELMDSLVWISKAEMVDKTWIRTDYKDEVLFSYPLPPAAGYDMVRQWKPQKRALRFEIEAQNFIEYLTEVKEKDPEHCPKNIQIFVLRKLDKARVKVVYTYNTTPEELVAKSDGWRLAAKNLPPLPMKKPWTPFPLEIARILNRAWKRNGELVTDKYKPAASYHGMELLFGVPAETLDRDLNLLVRNTFNLALYAGNCLNAATRRVWDKKQYPEMMERVGLPLVLAGMLLYWRGIRKDDYVNDFPFLLGQMLKVSDSLHELYCWFVRDKNIPPQLAGNSMYTLASEAPVKALAQLGQRMRPYIAWAETNPNEQLPPVRKDGKPGPPAWYYLFVYRKTADQLRSVMTPLTRLNDYEKAQLFIGYLASFPKPEKNDEPSADSDKTGGNEHDEH